MNYAPLSFYSRTMTMRMGELRSLSQRSAGCTNQDSRLCLEVPALNSNTTWWQYLVPELKRPSTFGSKLAVSSVSADFKAR